MQTFTPNQYLMIDIASNFGLDKTTWQTRLDWFADNATGIRELANLIDEGTRPASIAKHPLMKEADNPALFFAGVRAWSAAQRGEATGYPISLDATASGAQLLSVLIGCEKSARLCNVVDSGDREDLYTNIFDLMRSSAVEAGISPEEVTRDKAKTAVMTSLYGSKAQPREVFGEGDLLNIFYGTMEEEAPGIWALNEALLGLWNPTVDQYGWVLPDNFTVKIKVMDDHYETVTYEGVSFDVHTKVQRPMEEGRSIGANTIHSFDGMVVREILRRCNYNWSKIQTLTGLLCRPTTLRSNERSPNHQLVKTLWAHYEATGFLSARILELLDEDNMHLVDKAIIIEMVQTLPKKPFPVLAVHDCFRVHPNYGNDLRRQYVQILFELARSTALANVVSQIVGEPTQTHKYGDFSQQILQSEYALS